MVSHNLHINDLLRLGHRGTAVRVTKNPFFNFRILLKYRRGVVAARSSAATLSTVASREWNAMSDHQKIPYRKLADICKSKGKPFLASLQHLLTFVEFPDNNSFNEHVARVRPLTGAVNSTAIKGGGNPFSKASPDPRQFESPQPYVNFGGYDTSARRD